MCSLLLQRQKEVLPLEFLPADWGLLFLSRGVTVFLKVNRYPSGSLDIYYQDEKHLTFLSGVIAQILWEMYIQSLTPLSSRRS